MDGLRRGGRSRRRPRPTGRSSRISSALSGYRRCPTSTSGSNSEPPARGGRRRLRRRLVGDRDRTGLSARRVDGYDVDEASVRLATRQRRGGRRGRSGHVPGAGRRRPRARRPLRPGHGLRGNPRHVAPVEALRTMRVARGGRRRRPRRGREGRRGVQRARRRDRAADVQRTAFSAACAAGMSEQPSAETGTVMRPDTLRALRQEAGFARSRSCRSSTTSSGSTGSAPNRAR